MAQRVSSPVFVGRAAELERLRAAAARALDGAFTTVVVAGEAGVGKTRLLGELLDHAQEQGMLTLAGGCLDVGDGVVPYAPMVEALRGLPGLLDPEALDRVLDRAHTELAGLVPGLGTAADAAAPLPSGRLFELVLGLLHRLAEARPVLLVVEDLHWADESTRHLLGFLVRNLRGPVLLGLTYRDDEVHRSHPVRPFLAGLERGGRAGRVELGRLDRTELTEMLTEIRGQAPPAALTEEIVTRSEGNPFFAEELLAARSEGVELPAVLRDVLLARLERFSEETQRMLQIAAVAGRHVEHDLLAAVADTTPERLAAMLREAITHHVLAVQPDGVTYGFRHALVQEAIYDDLLPVQRVPLHAACARVLAARVRQPTGRSAGHGRVTTLGQLARHWNAAHQPDEALLASVNAGQAAEASGALPEAQRHYQRALDLWERAPEAAARSPLGRRDLLRHAAQAVAMVGDERTAVRLIGQALDDTDPHAEPLVAGGLLERQARYHWLVGDSPTALAVVERAVNTVPAEPPSPERARVLAAHGQMLLRGSRNRRARARCEEAIAVARRVGARTEEGHATNTLGVALTGLGHSEAGIEQLERSHRIAEELGDPDDLCRALFNLAHALLGTGRCAEAVPRALECHEVAGRFGMQGNIGVSVLGSGAEALVWLGRWEEAAGLLDRASGAATDAARRGRVTNALARLQAWRGDPAAADANASATLEAGWNVTDPQIVAPALALRATAATWAGRPVSARGDVAAGLERVAGADDPRYVVELCLAGLEAEAAVTERAAAARVPATRDRAAGLAEDMIERARAAATVAEVRTTPMVQGLLATAEAHVSRVVGLSDPELWTQAGDCWEDLGYPWPAVHARWRQAEALLAAGASRAQVAPALRRARTGSARLDARLLLAEIDALGRRARIDLAAQEAPDPGDTAAAPPEPDLGLTPREREVLALVSDGRTNRQIAQALYISDKTAGVHVSNILAKLGVANRAEAAVTAHRLGLTGTL